MDADRFDTLVATLVASLSRRTALRGLGGLGLAGLFGLTDAKKKKRRKKKCAKAGRKTSKKRKKCCAGLVKDATKRCGQRCTPESCPASSCGNLPDGCGGTLNCGGCPEDQICLLSNVCQPCTITCIGTPEQCGATLQQAFEAGGTYHVCPGIYRGGFSPADAVTLIGAGEGDDPASNTILDGGGAERVLTIPGGAGPVTLERMRITDGRVFSDGVNHIYGGAILHEGSALHLTECTVDNSYLLNTSQTLGASGGGIAVLTGSTLELTRCTVRDNHIIGRFSLGGGIYTEGATTLTDCLVEANTVDFFGGGLYVDGAMTALAGSTQVRGNVAGDGGGIYVLGGGAVLGIAETCRVTRNTAHGGNLAGGISNSGTVALEGPDPSPIVVNNCQYNCDDVPKCATTPVSCPV